MKLPILMLLAIPCFAAFTYTASPNALNVDHYGARLIMSTSVPTTATIIWSVNGTETACPSTYQYTDTDARGSVTDHIYFLSNNIPAGTAIHFQWCANDGSGVVGSNDQVFTTPALPAVHPVKATLPRVVPPSAVPTQTTGTTWTYGQTGCTTLTECFNSAQRQTGGGDTIVIPHGTTVMDTCKDGAGRPGACNVASWSPGQGYITLRTDSPDSALPPPGVRVDPVAYKSVMASLENPYVAHESCGTSIYCAGDHTAYNCAPGAEYWDVSDDNSPGFHMWTCTPGSWYSVSTITGSLANTSQPIEPTFTTEAPFSVGDIVYYDPTNATGDLMGEGQPIPRVGGTGIVTATQTGTVTVKFNNYWDVNVFSTPYTFSGTGGQIRKFTWVQPSYTVVPLSSLGTACTTLGAWGYDNTATHDNDPNYGAIPGMSTYNLSRCVDDGWGATDEIPNPGTRTYKWGARRLVTYPGVTNANSVWGLDLTSASHVVIKGLRLSYVNIPANPSFLSPGEVIGSGAFDIQGGKTANGSVYVGPGSDNIIFDQDYFDGRDYPNGTCCHQGIGYINGTNISVLNSVAQTSDYLFIGAQDRRMLAGTYAGYYSATLISSGIQGLLAQNDLIQGAGIGWHFDDSYAGIMPNQDITIKMVDFYRRNESTFGTSQNLAAYPEGVYEPTRHHLECKDCSYMELDGVSFKNSWRTANGGEAIELTVLTNSSYGGPPTYVTPGSGTVQFTQPPLSVTGSQMHLGDWLDCAGQYFQVTTEDPTNPVVHINGTTIAGYCARAGYDGGIHDLTFHNVSIDNVPNAYGLYGDNSYIGNQPIRPVPLKHWTLFNNLYTNVIDDLNHNDPGAFNLPGGGLVYASLSADMGDIRMEHETVYNVVGGEDGPFNPGNFSSVYNSQVCSWSGCDTSMIQTSEGLLIQNNLISMGATPTNCSPACTANSPVNTNNPSVLTGMDSLNTYFSPLNGGPVIGNNLFEQPSSTPSGYPGSVTWLNDPSQFDFSGTNNYRLKYNSPGISGAKLSSDGLDMGADIDQLEAAQGKVKNARAFSVGNTTASIGWYEGQDACPSIDWSTNNFSSYTRVSNSSSAGVQSVSLTGLTSDTSYQARINCPAQQPVIAFKTH